MQSVYYYIPETSHVSMVYCGSCSIVTVHATCNVTYNVECLVLGTFLSMCAVPCVVVFCSVLISFCLDILFKYYLNYFEMSPVSSCLTFVFTFYINCFSFINYLYFRILWNSF